MSLFPALYVRAPRLFEELAVARGDSRYRRLLARYARLDLLVLDDWGLSPLADEQRRELHHERSTRKGFVVGFAALLETCQGSYSFRLGKSLGCGFV